jgi:hypothetical protein
MSVWSGGGTADSNCQCAAQQWQLVAAAYWSRITKFSCVSLAQAVPQWLQHVLLAADHQLVAPALCMLCFFPQHVLCRLLKFVTIS